MLYLSSEDELVMELEREKRLIKEEWAIDSEQQTGGKDE